MTAEETVPSTTTAVVAEENPTKSGQRVALVLTLVAGYVNTVAFEKFGTTCAHMSGNVASFSRGRAESEGAALVAWVIASFFFGGILFALFKEWRDEKRLRAAMFVEAALLFTAMFGQKQALYFMAIAMGVQNAYTSSIKGLRTTHITGILTDVAHDVVIILNDLRRHRASLRKDLKTFYVHVSIPICFVTGGALGIPSCAALGLRALIAPILISLILAATYQDE